MLYFQIRGSRGNLSGVLYIRRDPSAARLIEHCLRSEPGPCINTSSPCYVLFRVPPLEGNQTDQDLFTLFGPTEALAYFLKKTFGALRLKLSVYLHLRSVDPLHAPSACATNELCMYNAGVLSCSFVHRRLWGQRKIFLARMPPPEGPLGCTASTLV